MSARKPFDLGRNCLRCGKPLTRKRRPSGKTEQFDQFQKRMYCDVVCAHSPRGESWRFWQKVAQVGECWEWQGYRAKNGYGRFHLTGVRKHVAAHRFAYEDMVAEIPEGLTIDHLCRNVACVNPWHLEPVPGRVNTLRGESVGAINARKTHCKRGHEFTPENTRVFNDRGHRSCRTCERLREAGAA